MNEKQWFWVRVPSESCVCVSLARATAWSSHTIPPTNIDLDRCGCWTATFGIKGHRAVDNILHLDKAVPAVFDIFASHVCACACVAPRRTHIHPVGASARQRHTAASGPQTFALWIISVETIMAVSSWTSRRRYGQLVSRQWHGDKHNHNSRNDDSDNNSRFNSNQTIHMSFTNAVHVGTFAALLLGTFGLISVANADNVAGFTGELPCCCVVVLELSSHLSISVLLLRLRLSLYLSACRSVCLFVWLCLYKCLASRLSSCNCGCC